MLATTHHLLLGASLFIVLAMPAAGEDTKPIRVLFIGNSYTYVNDLPGMIAALAKAGHQRPIESDKETPGGCTLEQHWRNGKAAAKIAAGTWDFVVLQEQSTRPLSDPALMTTYAARLDALITAQHAKTLLYQTWARQNAMERQPELSKTYTDLGKQLNADVVPAGTAWALALKSDPTLALHGEDKSHPTPAGTYLAACVFYATLYGKTSEGLPGKIGGLGDTAARKLQAIAWQAVQQQAGSN